MTVIPLQGAGPGAGAGAAGSWQSLYVFDMAASKWMALESARTPPRTAVVFAGETMLLLSGGAVLPGMHQVSSSAGPEPGAGAGGAAGCRFSTPFQLLARRTASLRPIGGGTTHQQLAGQFVDSLSAKRTSSNYVT